MKKLNLFYTTLIVLGLSFNTFAQSPFSNPNFKFVQDYLGNEQLLVTLQLDLENTTEHIIVLVSENQKDWLVLNEVNSNDLQEPNSLENIPFTFNLDVLSQKLELWIKVIDQNNNSLAEDIYLKPSEVQSLENTSTLGVAFSN